MFKLSERGVAHILLIILLLAGLGIAVYLVGRETNIIPKAYEPKKFPLSAPVTPSPTPGSFTCSACAADIVKSARNRVDAQDNAVMSSCFGKPPSTTLPGGRSCAPADINKDGSINQTDADCLRSVYFQTCAATPSPTPQAAKRVFVTSTTYNGNLGGLAGADSKCQARADTANLGGTWKAWLSDGTGSPSSRFVQSNQAYKRMDGVTIANNWADLTDGSLKNPINVTELGTTLNWMTWSNTTSFGLLLGGNSCDRWSQAIRGFGAVGVSSAVDKNWTFDISLEATSCDSTLPLYCFEQ